MGRHECGQPGFVEDDCMTNVLANKAPVRDWVIEKHLRHLAVPIEIEGRHPCTPFELREPDAWRMNVIRKKSALHGSTFHGWTAVAQESSGAGCRSNGE